MKRTIATAGAAWLAATVLTQASAVAAPASGAAAARQTHRPPNIVVILVDDLGWPDVSVYGRKTVPTPNLERLARDGVAYTNGYVAASVCAVSRAALLTGRMPQRYGFQYNLDDSANHDQGLPLDQATLADRLKAQGYRTAAIGKWHQGYTPAYYPTKRGFAPSTDFSRARRSMPIRAQPASSPRRFGATKATRGRTAGIRSPAPTAIPWRTIPGISPTISPIRPLPSSAAAPMSESPFSCTWPIMRRTGRCRFRKLGTIALRRSRTRCAAPSSR